MQRIQFLIHQYMLNFSPTARSLVTGCLTSPKNPPRFPQAIPLTEYSSKSISFKSTQRRISINLRVIHVEGQFSLQGQQHCMPFVTSNISFLYNFKSKANEHWIKCKGFSRHTFSSPYKKAYPYCQSMQLISQFNHLNYE